jgi:dienelactone hydrolase
MDRKQRLSSSSPIVSPNAALHVNALLMHTVFGWELPNTRILADEYAKAGFYCYLPDFFEGDSIPISFLQNVEPPAKEAEKLTMVDKAKNAALIPVTLGPWLAKHREAVARPMIDGFINTVRQIPGTNKVGVIGFCWGGRYAILQAHGTKMNEQGTNMGGIDAAVAFHPSLVAVPGDFEHVERPLSIGFGTKDSLVDEKTRQGVRDVIGGRANVEIRDYEDQIHGFAVRGDWSSEKDKQAIDDAQKQGVDFFNKHLS